MKTKVNTNEQSTNDEESNNTKNKFVTIKVKGKNLSKREKRKIICKKYREKKKQYVIELEREYSNLKSQLSSLKNQTDFCSNNDLLFLISSQLNNFSYKSFFFPSFNLNTKDDLVKYLNFIRKQRMLLSNCFFSSLNKRILIKEMIMISDLIEKLLISIVFFVNGAINIDTYY